MKEFCWTDLETGAGFGCIAKFEKRAKDLLFDFFHRELFFLVRKNPPTKETISEGKFQFVFDLPPLPGIFGGGSYEYVSDVSDTETAIRTFIDLMSNEFIFLHLEKMDCTIFHSSEQHESTFLVEKDVGHEDDDDELDITDKAMEKLDRFCQANQSI
ncbi:MAG: hypothetical protein Satyrvirus29_4 [Satyrvirus sp.]|uniref:Uncharacterized protein n=1 Tax=Satyrvirus sp. TaxID=2487771 RepID=A0A3G5AIN8_9VIRU|nr:MAG: hypothetical protein Satyrvirus29_4 [Satyrvirus sp.]